MSFLKKLFGGADDEKAAEQMVDVRKFPGLEGALTSAGCDSLQGASGEFGKCVGNPVPVNGPVGEVKYLNRLVCPCGKLLIAHRLGSTRSGPWAESIDVFETVCAEGKHWDILFFHFYHPRRSTLLPAGYSRAPFHPQFSRTTLGMTVTSHVADFPGDIQQAVLMEFGETMGKAVLNKIGYKLGMTGAFIPPPEHVQRKNTITIDGMMT